MRKHQYQHTLIVNRLPSITPFLVTETTVVLPVLDTGPVHHYEYTPSLYHAVLDHLPTTVLLCLDSADLT